MAERAALSTSAEATTADRRPPANTSRPEICASARLDNLLLTIPEAASLCRVSNRTVWRLMADPKAGFPKPRRLRGRTLLVREELLEFLDVARSR
jgi:excisionase family DNA binding protein